MGALPRPDIPPGTQRELVDALHDLHHRAGWPSLRALAGQVGCSHTTVSNVLRSERLPAWGVVELLVEAMGGDVPRFRELWLAASRPETAIAAPLIAGRRDELAVVRRHVETGTGLLLVVGEAGIGKTKLVETAAGVASEVFVARGNCLPLSRSVPLLPIATALRDVHERGGGEWLRSVLASAPGYVADVMASLLPGLDHSAGPIVDGDWARHRLFNAVDTVITQLAGSRRLAVYLEDLHWADAATLELLEHLLTRRLPVPMLATFRLEDESVPSVNVAWFDRIRRSSAVRVTELAPLSREETAEQLTLLLGRRARQALVDRIHHRTAGLPLFTEQLANQEGGQGDGQGDGEWRLPRLLSDLLDRRLDDLDQESWRLVRALGVADRSLPAETLRSVAGLSPDDQADALRDLVRRRLLGNAGTGEVALRHPLLAEAVRRRVVPGELEEIHRRLAVELAREPAADAAEIATHWQAAGDTEQEQAWRIRAARSARTRVAFGPEADLWRRALELWPPGDLDERHGVRRIDAELSLLDALEQSGQVEEAWKRSQPLRARVETLPPALAAEVLYRSASYGTQVSGVDSTLADSARAVELFETEPVSRGMVRALTQYVFVLFGAGRLDEASAATDRLVAACRLLGDPAELRRALTVQALRVEDVARVRAALDQANRVELPEPDPIGDTWIGVIETDLMLKHGGGADAVLEAGRRGLAAADEWHLDTFYASLVRYNIALGLLRAGRVDDAAALIDPRTEAPPRADTASLHTMRVALDTVRGRLEHAAARLEVLWTTGAADLASDRESNAVVSECDLWRGRPETVLDRIERVVREPIGSSDRILAGECHVVAVRAAADTADQEPTKRAQLHHRVGRLLEGDDPTTVPSAAQGAYRAARTAELARLSGEPHPELWTTAAREWDRIDRRFDAGYCRWRAAQAALATSQGTIAQRLLARAAKDARGHVPLTEAVQTTAGGQPGHSNTDQAAVASANRRTTSAPQG